MLMLTIDLSTDYFLIDQYNGQKKDLFSTSLFKKALL